MTPTNDPNGGRMDDAGRDQAAEIIKYGMLGKVHSTMDARDIELLNAAETGGHKWWKWHGMVCCEHCGIIENGHNKPCRGPVKVEIRK